MLVYVLGESLWLQYRESMGRSQQAKEENQFKKNYCDNTW